MSDVAEYDGRFEEAGAPMAARQDAVGQATRIEQARAIGEVRAMVMLARDYPRDEEMARTKMERVCRMTSVAEHAFFRVQRGYEKDQSGKDRTVNGKKVPAFVSGESIQLARELARCWGNLEYSVREMSRDDVRGQSEMMAYCWDLEGNTRPSTVFIVAHRMGRYRITSNQQIYENNASHAARRLREQIFAALPEWFKEEARELCHETLRRGDGKTAFPERVKIAIAEFEKIGVQPPLIEKKFGREIGKLTPEDLATMRVILRSIRRGETRMELEFGLEGEDEPPPPDRPSGARLDALEARIIEAEVAAETAKTPDPNEPAKESASDVPGDPPADPRLAGLSQKGAALLKEFLDLDEAGDVIAQELNAALKAQIGRLGKDEQTRIGAAIEAHKAMLREKSKTQT